MYTAKTLKSAYKHIKSTFPPAFGPNFYMEMSNISVTFCNSGFHVDQICIVHVQWPCILLKIQEVNLLPSKNADYYVYVLTPLWNFSKKSSIMVQTGVP